MDKVVEQWGRVQNYGRDWVGPFICLVQVVSPEYIKLAVANAGELTVCVWGVCGVCVCLGWGVWGGCICDEYANVSPNGGHVRTRA